MITRRDFAAGSSSSWFLGSPQYSSAKDSPELTAFSTFVGCLEPVRLCASTNIDIFEGGLLTIDGIQARAGDRVLLVAQRDGTENGVYDASQAAWRRSEDTAISRGLGKGITVHVQEGHQYADAVFEFRRPQLILGRDAIEVAQISSPAIVRSYLRDYDWIFRPTFYDQRVGEGSEDVDTGAIEAMIAEMFTNGGHYAHFPALRYNINPISMPISRTYVLAKGAEFILNRPGVAFNFNVDADPSDVEKTAKSFGQWIGGTFTSREENPTERFSAFQLFAVRQMIIENAIFGTKPGTVGGRETHLSEGIVVGGLGAHLFRKNRFYRVDKAIHGPNWAGQIDTVSTTLTTSSIELNEFTLGPGQSAIHFDGGWERIRVRGGYVNGAKDSACMYFSNRKGTPRRLTIDGVSYEQAAPDGQFLFIEDVGSGKTSTDIRIVDTEFNGDPENGGHTHIKLERTRRVGLQGVFTSALIATGNASLSMDRNCDGLTVDSNCRMTDPRLIVSPCLIIDPGVRRERFKFPSVKLTSPLPLSGYQGTFHSAGTQIVRIPELIEEGWYQKHGVAPNGYSLRIKVASNEYDNGATKLIVGSTLDDVMGESVGNTIDVMGEASDAVHGIDIYQPAYVDGSISLRVQASVDARIQLWLSLLSMEY